MVRRGQGESEWRGIGDDMDNAATTLIAIVAAIVTAADIIVGMRSLEQVAEEATLDEKCLLYVSKE